MGSLLILCIARQCEYNDGDTDDNDNNLTNDIIPHMLSKLRRSCSDLWSDWSTWYFKGTHITRIRNGDQTSYPRLGQSVTVHLVGWLASTGKEFFAKDNYT